MKPESLERGRPSPRRRPPWTEQLDQASLLAGCVGIVLIGLASALSGHSGAVERPSLWIMVFGLAAGLPGILFGHIAQRLPRRPPKEGNDLSNPLFGLIMGYTCLLFALAGGLGIPAEWARLARQHRSFCVQGCNLIQGAKATWALERGKGPADVPLESDLFGPGKYLEDEPYCPEGGHYTINAVSRWPNCSVHHQ